jgi:hypothetical protein
MPLTSELLCALFLWFRDAGGGDGCFFPFNFAFAAHTV